MTAGGGRGTVMTSTGGREWERERDRDRERELERERESGMYRVTWVRVVMMSGSGRLR